MSPETRQKLHALFDQMLDAIEEDKNVEPRKRQRRALTLRGVPVDEASIERAVKSARRAGML